MYTYKQIYIHNICTCIRLFMYIYMYIYSWRVRVMRRARISSPVSCMRFACMEGGVPSELEGNNLKGFQDFHLKAQSKIWP